MKLSLVALVSAFASTAWAQAVTAIDRVDNSTLWLNAIVGKKNLSTVECWGIQPPFVVSTQPGTVGNKILQLGALANASYSEFPVGPNINAGLHNAPNAQYVVLLAGNGTISFPSGQTPDLLVRSNQILIAVDTPGTSAEGHNSLWAGGTRVLQMPFEGGVHPPHRTVKGKCPS